MPNPAPISTAASTKGNPAPAGEKMKKSSPKKTPSQAPEAAPARRDRRRRGQMRPRRRCLHPRGGDLRAGSAEVELVADPVPDAWRRRRAVGGVGVPGGLHDVAQLGDLLGARGAAEQVLRGVRQLLAQRDKGEVVLRRVRHRPPPVVVAGPPDRGGCGS